MYELRETYFHTTKRFVTSGTRLWVPWNTYEDAVQCAKDMVDELNETFVCVYERDKNGNWKEAKYVR